MHECSIKLNKTAQAVHIDYCDMERAKHKIEKKPLKTGNIKFKVVNSKCLVRVNMMKYVVGKV